ncbi:MAG: Plug domain-containing protein, partial [Pseudomonadota bacterium]
MTKCALLLGSALAIGLPAAASAQDTDVDDVAPRDAVQADDNADLMLGEEEEDGLRTIIVTATRRAESIQSVPVAVSALDEEALEQANIDDIRDIAGRVPSLVVDQVNAGPSAAAISIRGISFEDIEKSFDPAVGVVVDGVFIGTNTGQLLDSFDIESLEVLRGPQGTLF